MFPRRLGKAVAAAAPLYVEDVFSAFTYTGNGSTQSIVNGIDLSTYGGLVWAKRRDSIGGHHSLTDTARGAKKSLSSNLTSAEIAAAAGNNDLYSFNSNGFSVGPNVNSGFNGSGESLVSWTFRKAAKFFDVQTKTHTTGTPSTVDLSILGTVGQVIVKRTDSTGEWYVWHRSLTAGNNLRLNTTAAQSTTDAHLSVSGTTLTIASGMPSGTYVVYAWAHDTSTDGIIQCGSYTGNANASNTINLGWEAQYVLIKPASGGTGHWFIYDTARGLCLNSDATLAANGSFTEADFGTQNYIEPCANGFRAISDNNATNGAGFTYVYMAIRKGLMRPPTDATKVFAINARTGTGAAATVTAGSITQGVDLHIVKRRNGATNGFISDRLRGTGSQLTPSGTDAENTFTTVVTAFNMDGITAGTESNINAIPSTYINYFLKQARGFFDIVAYTGTASAHTEAHNLGVVPELIITKSRSGVTNWAVYYGVPTKALFLESTSAGYTSILAWNDTAPTSSVFSLGADGFTNSNGNTSIAYLFASAPGVSKIGTYTGNATTNQINCGFAAGARFVLIKRIDSTGDWYFWDTTRGIVSGNDPYLLLNSTAIEVTGVTGTDYIDPYSAGFELSSTAPAALNASGGTFMFLAIA